MSILVGRIDQFLTFNEWLLSESILPTKVEYGNNPPLFNNKKILNYIGDVSGSCFISDNLLYSIQFNADGEIAFGVSNKLPKDIKELAHVKFSDDRIITKSALSVFNKVFYVLVELLQKQKRNVFFRSANGKLEGIYNAMLKNKYFNDELNKLGYSNLYLDNGLYKLDYKK